MYNLIWKYIRGSYPSYYELQVGDTQSIVILDGYRYILGYSFATYRLRVSIHNTLFHEGVYKSCLKAKRAAIRVLGWLYV